MQQSLKAAIEDAMKGILKDRPDILQSILPSFAVGCRRVTPGLGFLEALVQKNVEFVNTAITSIDKTGITTADMVHHDLDVLVCSTGFNASSPPPFTVTGLNSKTIQAAFLPRPRTYLSLAVNGFPNYFMMLGPNGAIGTGSLIVMIEGFGDYIVKCIRKIQKENLKCMDVSENAVDDFMCHVDTYFKRTVFSDTCKSWYRSNGGNGDKITGLWPGSCLHCLEVLRSPRWEDFKYEHQGKTSSWLGYGWTAREKESRDLAWYLDPALMSTPVSPLPEASPMYHILPFTH